MINTLQSSLSQAKELLDAMDEQIKMYDGVIDSMIANHGFNKRLRDVLSKMSKEAVEQIDSAKVDRIITFTQSKLDEINAAKDEDTDEKKAMTFSEYCISCFKEIYDCCVQYADAIKEKENLDKEIRDITNKSYDASTSSKARLEKVESLEKQLDSETDPDKKAKIQKMLNTVRKTEDLSFLTERIVKIGDNEVRNIINTFFHQKRSSLIMDKFRIRIKRLGYDENTYKMFFNIEEMFLPEEYYPMNNMFLFMAMRFISYADTNNKDDALFCSSLLIKMYNLVYHRFSTPEEEAEFINQIKAVDDYFAPYKETLIEKNVTSPNHPTRQEAHRENEARLRESLCNAIIAHGEKLTDEVVKMDIKELKEYLEKIVADEKAKKEAEVDSFVSEIEPEKVEEVDPDNGEVENSVLENPEEDNSVMFPDMKSAADALRDEVDQKIMGSTTSDEKATADALRAQQAEARGNIATTGTTSDEEVSADEQKTDDTTERKPRTVILHPIYNKTDTISHEEAADIAEIVKETGDALNLDEDTVKAIKEIPDETVLKTLDAQYVDEDHYQKAKELHESRAYESMVIERRGDVNIPVAFDMTNQYAYVDNYGDIYVPAIGGNTYDFYDSRDGHRVEQNVDEIAVLQLCSSGAVTKKIFSKGILNPTRDTLSDFKFRA